MTQEKVLLFEKKGPIAYITFNRPEVINAMNGEVYDLLREAVSEFTRDDELRCAIVTGAGGNFSSGGDIKWFREMRVRNKAEGRVDEYDFPAYKALQQCPKPLIAAVDGYCLASGFNCAVLYSDIRIASERAKFGIPAIKRGMSINYPIPYTWHMSLGNTLYMMLTGKQLSAEEALRMGLVSEVVPHENLMDRATELANMIAAGAPRHVRAYKQFFRRFVEAPGSFGQSLVDLVMGPLSYSEDYFEGTKAFLDKREPEFKSE